MTAFGSRGAISPRAASSKSCRVGERQALPQLGLLLGDERLSGLGCRSHIDTFVSCSLETGPRSPESQLRPKQRSMAVNCYSRTLGMAVSSRPEPTEDRPPCLPQMLPGRSERAQQLPDTNYALCTD
ncbi:hypothetical protein GCM10010424_38070 [Streptomyces lienomycini]